MYNRGLSSLTFASERGGAPLQSDHLTCKGLSQGGEALAREVAGGEGTRKRKREKEVRHHQGCVTHAKRRPGYRQLIESLQSSQGHRIY